MSDLKIRQVTPADAERCHTIETTAYEGDEAATYEKIVKRIRSYPEGFIVLEYNAEVAGFINCGATHKVELDKEEFKDLVGHDSKGLHVVIFSVVVHPQYQGKGLAGRLLNSFIARMKSMHKASINLICRKRHIDFYRKFGFTYLQESASTHGGLIWHEMVLNL